MTAAAEITANVRKRIKQAGIKARVRYVLACGVHRLQVIVPSYTARFTAAEIEAFCAIAKTNRLTGARGAEIDPVAQGQLIEKIQWDFEIPETVFQRKRELDAQYVGNFRNV